MSEKIIGVDVDGILANFNEAYINLLWKTTGKDRFGAYPDASKVDTHCWQYPESHGYTKEEENFTWAAILEDPHFWENLPAYPDAKGFLNELWLSISDRGKVPVYFITNRMGASPHQQTARWLHRHMFDQPNVLISSKKGLSCAALGITHYIDDKIENVVDVARETDARVFLLDRPWNQTTTSFLSVERIGSLEEFAKELRKA